MNPIHQLAKQIEIKRAEAHLKNLKSNNNMTPTPVSNLLTITNSAGETLVPVTRRNAAGKIVTENLTPEAAIAWSKTVTRSTTKPTARPTASARPTPAQPAPGLVTASTYATKPLVMARAEFRKLTAADKSRFLAAKGTLAN